PQAKALRQPSPHLRLRGPASPVRSAGTHPERQGHPSSPYSLKQAAPSHRLQALRCFHASSPFLSTPRRAESKPLERRSPGKPLTSCIWKGMSSAKQLSEAEPR